MTVVRLECDPPLDTTDQELASAVVRLSCPAVWCRNGALYACPDIPLISLVHAVGAVVKRPVVAWVVTEAVIYNDFKLAQWLQDHGVTINLIQ